MNPTTQPDTAKNSITFKKGVYVQKSYCFSFTVTPNQSLLYISSKAKFIILQLFLRMGQLKKLGLIFGHNNEVITCQVFMKKSNQFASAGFDKQILLWTFNQKQSWIISEQLEGHNHPISCLILNKEEDLLISGSLDKTVRFWGKIKYWQCQQVIVFNQVQVLSMSLNLTENKLIVCGLQSTIIVLEQFQAKQEWSKIQTIEAGEGKKLCFLNDYAFVFQPNKGNFIKIFKQSEQDQQYKQSGLMQLNESLRCYWQFPIKCIQQQNLLLIKKGNIVNLMKYKEQEEFQILQQIHFHTGAIFGTISENARYLITWEGDEILEKKFGSNQIAIRIFKQIN